MYRYEKRESKFKKILSILVLMCIVSIASIYVYKTYSGINVEIKEEDNTTKAVRLATVQNKTDEEFDTLEKATKCVVGISKIKNNGDNVLEAKTVENLNLGTGTIITDNGYILTNWHVAGNKYSSCYVTLENGQIYNGDTVWADEDLDLAIVKISANGLNYISLGDSDNIKIGKNVYAIGNPIGIEFQRTVTAGIISGLNRTIKIEEEGEKSYMEGLIQTDASINEGNSGGPLINASGEVLGINTIKIESAEGIGFAIPINIVKPIIESLINTGKFEEAYLGIFAYDKEVTKYLENKLEFNNGIYVVKIMQDGPIAKSNIKIGDIITEIDGNPINRMGELRRYIYTKKPGDKAKLTYLRNNKTYQAEIVLEKNK